MEPGTVGGETSESSYKFYNELNYKHAVFPNDKGVLTAKGALMPVEMGLGENGAFNFSPITLADGLSYKYQSNGGVYQGNLKLKTPDGALINIENGKSIVPKGDYDTTEKRGDLILLRKASADDNGEIKFKNGLDIFLNDKKLELLGTGDERFAFSKDVGWWI